MQAQATATAMQSINQLVAANPSLNAALDASGGTTGKKLITQQAQDIDSQYPQISAIIHANGLQTREFIVITGGPSQFNVQLGADKDEVYTLTATASDLAGNAITKQATCTVPHDQGK